MDPASLFYLGKGALEAGKAVSNWQSGKSLEKQVTVLVADNLRLLEITLAQQKKVSELENRLSGLTYTDPKVFGLILFLVVALNMLVTWAICASYH